MDRIILRTLALGQALTSLSMAGCKEASISLVPHAVKVEGIKEDGEILTLHVWSKEAEETAASVGKGRELTENECKWLDKSHPEGGCPICEDHRQLYKGPKEGLAINVSCDVGHTFWVPPPPFKPEYLGEREKEPIVIAEETTEVGEETAEQGVEDEASNTE